MANILLPNVPAVWYTLRVIDRLKLSLSYKIYKLHLGL